jgi:phenylacetate-CoA oxygenase/reductase PaaK subunit
MAGAAAAATAGRRARSLPDPGERVPALALPTVALFLGSLAVWCVATWAAIGGHAPVWVTIPVHAAVSFLMFTVLHDASHYSISRVRWVNGAFGRLATPFVAAYMSFPMFSFIHIQHHRNANEHSDTDPDHYTSEGAWWSLPFRWLTIDAAYGRFYFARRSERPAAEIRESIACATLTIAGVAAAAATGHLWTLALVYLIPQRIALMVLAWWFDWLPHHDLAHTQRSNRYGATRIRVGLEWVMTPLMLSQNYHLVHHLHPSIPFYRYLPAWRRNEESYLEHEPAVATVFGRAITAGEYRSLRSQSALARALPIRIPEGTASPHAIFHHLRVAELSRPSPDSVAITFDVPDILAPHFRFRAGQHITVRTDLGGHGVRRNYSICAPATTGKLRIGVKRIPGGAFSSWAASELSVGDEIEVMTPAGSFGPDLDPRNAKHYAALAAGSGITPILSILSTALEVEPDSRFTLIYANRKRESTMFRDELDALESRYSDRLEVLHVLSRERQRDPLLDGRLDEDRIARLLAERVPASSVDEWFLCGPVDLVSATREQLLDAGADVDRVHVELFEIPETDGAVAAEDAQPCEVTFTLDGSVATFDLNPGDTVLEGALGIRDDVPYSCMGGACGTCRAKLVEGDVEMDHDYALKRSEVDAGYILTCQSRPTTAELKVDYDA